MASDLDTLTATLAGLESRLIDRIDGVEKRLTDKIDAVETSLLNRMADNLDSCVTTIETTSGLLQSSILGMRTRYETNRIDVNDRLEKLTRRLESLERRAG